MTVQQKIEAIINSDMDTTPQFAEDTLNWAQELANQKKENIYICGDIGCVYFVPHSYLTMAEDVICHVEPA